MKYKEKIGCSCLQCKANRKWRQYVHRNAQKYYYMSFMEDCNYHSYCISESHPVMVLIDYRRQYKNIHLNFFAEIPKAVYLQMSKFMDSLKNEAKEKFHD